MLKCNIFPKVAGEPDRGQISLVFDGQGNQTHRYLYGMEIDQVLADETSAGVLWALTDYQGTVKDLVDNGIYISATDNGPGLSIQGTSGIQIKPLYNAPRVYRTYDYFGNR